MNFRSIFILIAMLASALASARASEPRSRKQVRGSQSSASVPPWHKSCFTLRQE
jgi:hypothetical protein